MAKITIFGIPHTRRPHSGLDRMTPDQFYFKSVPSSRQLNRAAIPLVRLNEDVQTNGASSYNNSDRFMITDEEVVRLFRNIPGTPPGFIDSDRPCRSNQIFRGIPLPDPHPGRCTRHMQIFIKHKIIPKYCFDCYKIVVEPRTVMEQFKLLMVFEKIALPFDNLRKCMVECRESCSGAYKGLIYCLGMEDGNELLKIVREVVSEDISPLVSVTLKRGCSEYADAYPEYPKPKPAEESMQYDKDWQIHEETFDKEYSFYVAPSSIIDVYPNGYTPLEVFGLKCWLRYAATIGDMSYLTIAGMTLPPMPHIQRPPWTP